MGHNGPMTERTVNGAAIRRRREELYRTRSAFCRACDISLSHMKRIEAGEAGTLFPGTAHAIARALDWTVDDLYAGRDAEVAA
jgi:transcriptional regulator with XRE-family HTH domain